MFPKTAHAKNTNVIISCTFLSSSLSVSPPSFPFANETSRSLFLSCLYFTLPLSSISQEESSHDTSGYANTAKDGDAHESFAGNLVVDEGAQVRGLQIGGLLVEE